MKEIFRYIDKFDDEVHVTLFYTEGKHNGIIVTNEKEMKDCMYSYPSLYDAYERAESIANEHGCYSIPCSCVAYPLHWRRIINNFFRSIKMDLKMMIASIR
jgi:N-acetyl-gamma-glutamylphosphate reductase